MSGLRFVMRFSWVLGGTCLLWLIVVLTIAFVG